MSENLVVGSIVEGKVMKVVPFGAIVSLEGNVQGLVHISQIANSFVQNINDHISIGDEVKVKVLSVDEQTRKIALSIRDALPEQPKPQSRPQRPYQSKSREQYSDQSKPRYDNNNSYQSSQAPPILDFEDRMKEFLKQANEKQAGLNKRNNKR